MANFADTDDRDDSDPFDLATDNQSLSTSCTSVTTNSKILFITKTTDVQNISIKQKQMIHYFISELI